PLNVQQAMLDETIDAYTSGEEAGDPNESDWINGNLDGIAAEMDTLPPELYETLITRRNRNFADWLARRLDRPGTVLFAIGAGHLLDGRTWFTDEVKTAFDASGELVLEARLPEDPSSLQGMIIRYALDPRGPTLSSRLTPAQNATLNRALGTIGVPQGAFEHMEPWFVSLTLSAVLIQQLGLNTDHGPETILTRAAQARQIPIGELEGMEHQIRIFDAM